MLHWTICPSVCNVDMLHYNNNYLSIYLSITTVYIIYLQYIPCVAIISHARYVLKSDRNDRPRHCESSKLMINRQSTHCDGASEPSVLIF